jgi:hypothetical protein
LLTRTYNLKNIKPRCPNENQLSTFRVHLIYKETMFTNA